jgi:hypothetical protein
MSLIRDVVLIGDPPPPLVDELQKRGYHVSTASPDPGTWPEDALVWVGLGKQACTRFCLATPMTGLLTVEGDPRTPDQITKVANAVDQAARTTLEARQDPHTQAQVFEDSFAKSSSLSPELRFIQTVMLGRGGHDAQVDSRH